MREYCVLWTKGCNYWPTTRWSRIILTPLIDWLMIRVLISQKIFDRAIWGKRHKRLLAVHTWMTQSVLVIMSFCKNWYMRTRPCFGDLKSIWVYDEYYFSLVYCRANTDDMAYEYYSVVSLLNGGLKIERYSKANEHSLRLNQDIAWKGFLSRNRNLAWKRVQQRRAPLPIERK